MADYSGSIIESQVDWLTVSAHGETRASRLLDLAHSLEPQQRAAGNRSRAWRLMGYEGFHCGALEYGSRGRDHATVRLIGDLAERELVKALSVADLVTRLDLAVTWRAEPPDPLLGANAYSMAEMWHASHPKGAMPSRVTDAAGGYTVYLGRRTSDAMLRLYNKGQETMAKGDLAEQERYRDCWRYELECKGGVAPRLAETVNLADDRALYVQSYVYEWTRKHGIEPAFPREGAVKLVPGFRRRSDSDSKLRHLAKNVRPSIEWLRADGKLDLARKALGLEEG